MKNTEKYTTNLLGDRVSVESLIRDLKSPDSFVRWAAAWSLQDTKNKRVVDHLVKALNDTDPTVRAAAATALGWMKDERAVEPLIKSLKDRDDEVRLAAIKALGEIGDERAAHPLLLLSEKEGLYSITTITALRSLMLIYFKAYRE